MDRSPRYVIRNEHFGATIYDRQTLTHEFLGHEAIPRHLSSLQSRGEDYDNWVVDFGGASEEIIYSPIRVYFELTRKCTLRCRMCFNDSGVHAADELSTNEVLKILDALRLAAVFDVRFSGGEPTTHPDWYEILAYAKSIGLTVSMNTNGFFPDMKIPAQLVQLGLDQVAVSLDGNERVHDNLRGAGVFRRVVETLEYLAIHNAPTRINSIVTRHSMDSLEDVLELAGRYAKEVNFFYMRTSGRARDILDDAIDFEGLHRFGMRVEGLKERYPHVNVLYGSQVMQNNSVKRRQSNGFNLKMGGPDGFTRLNILPDGIVYPGGYTPHIASDYSLGDLRAYGYNLLDIWQNHPALWKFREESMRLQEHCEACPEKENRCPGASMEMDLYRQRFNEPNPYCLYLSPAFREVSH